MSKCPRHNLEICEDCEVERLENRLRQYKRMGKEMAGQVEISEFAILDCLRAAGDAVCERCGLEYIEHPQLLNLPTFHLTCAGKVVKL